MGNYVNPAAAPHPEDAAAAQTSQRKPRLG